MILKDQWGMMVNLNTLMASIIAQGYYAYSGSIAGVFQPDAFQNDAFQMVNAQGTRMGVYISLNDERMSLVRLDPAPAEVQNVMQDLYNGETMVLRDGVVNVVDLRKLNPYGTYRWRSKIFQLPYLQNLGALKIYWTPAQVQPAPGNTFVRVYAGERADAISSGLPLKYQNQLAPSGDMMRLPSGYKAQYYQFEIEGYDIIDALHCAQTARELRAI
jgi:hypothetical protein